MHTEFRQSRKPEEIRSLLLFDRKAFHQYPADWFDRADWQAFESWWLLLDSRKIGCCAFEPASEPGLLYIASSAILPSFHGQGFGTLLKSWQIAYARRRGFTRIVTNTRKSNRPMIMLNRKFGFKIRRTFKSYYENPSEPALVMELIL